MFQGNRKSHALMAGFAAVALSALVLLAGCSDAEQAISQFTGDSDTGAVTPATAPAVIETGTPTGQRVMAIRSELQRLDDDLARHETEFRAARANLAKDRAAYGDAAGDLAAPPDGTAPGPALVAQYGRAQGDLDRIADEVGALYVLSRETAGDLAMARRLGDESKRAGAIPGGNDKDHEQIATLSGAIATDLAAAERVAGEISAEVEAQNRFVAGERRRLAALGIAPAAPPRAEIAAGPGAAPVAAPPAPNPLAAREPLVTIRFDRPDVPFQHTLYLAVSSALDRKPDIHFNVVAVSPNAGSAAQVAVNADAARHNAGAVMRSLLAMGLPANRIAISAVTSAEVHVGEVRLYVE
jgi:hypothetical protein